MFLRNILKDHKPVGIYCNIQYDLHTIKIKDNINIIFLCYIDANCTYKKRSNELTDILGAIISFNRLKSFIKNMKNQNKIVMLCLRGNFDYYYYDPYPIVSLLTDLGCDGIDIYIDEKCLYINHIIQVLREYIPKNLLSLTISNMIDQDTLQLIKQHSFQLDWINIINIPNNWNDNIDFIKKYYNKYFKGQKLIKKDTLLV
jgi:hypothetical protein